MIKEEALRKSRGLFFAGGYSIVPVKKTMEIRSTVFFYFLN